MIGSIRGRIINKTASELLVDVSGVGYVVSVPLGVISDSPPEGGEIFLHIHTHVREDSIQLFGFSAMNEKRAFTTLISVSGVGPKVALSILSAMQYDDFLKAVEAEDITLLTSIPGLGKKTANRVVLELKGKLPKAESQRDPAYSDALSALVNLGYRKAEAQEAIDSVVKNGASGIETMLKEALKYLTGIPDEKTRR